MKGSCDPGKEEKEVGEGNGENACVRLLLESQKHFMSKVNG